MALLPTLNYEYSEREVTDTFRGYRHQLKIDEGEFYDMRNPTSESYPLLANRRRRGRVCSLQAPGGLLAKNKLAWVENGCLYFDGTATALTGLSAGKKQLVSMGAYIVVFPDKKYYNTANPTDRGSLGAVYTSAGAVEYTLCRADGTAYQQPAVSDTAPEEPDNAALWIDTSRQTHVLRQWSAAMGEWNEITTVYTKLRFRSEGELPGLFSVYDGVSITGAAPDGIDGDKVLFAVGGGSGVLDYIVVTGLLEQAATQTEGSVRIERSVPELDFVIECQNRLWGCCYGTENGKTLNKLYCCALGDFKNWRQYMGLSTDSWTASVGSDGPWTGAVSYLGCPMFFKENRIHRVTVSAAGAHAVSEIVCRGVQAGSAESLQVVNETLFYKSRSDVCVYQGGFPQSISEALGSGLFSDAAAGAAGERYYLSMRGEDGDWRLFVYDIRHGLWMREDELHAEAFARLGDELYALTAERMAEAIILRRGGKGLASGSAVLHISAPAGAAITLSFGGVTAATLTPGKGHTNAGDSAAADWFYPVISAAFGAWTVTAAKDGKSVSKTVTVDANKTYDVRLRFEYYVFKSGSGFQNGFSTDELEEHTRAGGLDLSGGLSCGPARELRPRHGRRGLEGRPARGGDGGPLGAQDLSGRAAEAGENGMNTKKRRGGSRGAFA